MRKALNSFWAWYEKHYVLNAAIATVLFLLQIVHLYWLTADVAIPRLGGVSLFPATGWLRTLIILVDYTEIPALISVSLLYINDIRLKGWRLRPILFLLLLNSQWLHLFWITDEFVVNQFQVEPNLEPHSHPGDALHAEKDSHSSNTILPIWLAWIAILIDYLEIPVMIDTIFKFVRATRETNVRRIVRDMTGQPPRPEPGE